MSVDPLGSGAVAGDSTGQGRQAPSKLAPLDPVRVLRQHARVLIVTGILAVIVGVALWAALRNFAPEYTSESRLYASAGPQSWGDTGGQPMGGVSEGGLRVISAFIQNQTILLTSDELMSLVLRREDVRNTNWFRSFDGDVRKAKEDLQDRLEAGLVRGSTIMSVTLSSPFQGDLQVILDATVEVYLARVRQDMFENTTLVRRMFTTERDRLSRELEQIQEQMARFVSEHDLTSLRVASDEASIGYQQLAEQRGRLLMAADSLRQRYESLAQSHQAGTPIYTATDMAEVEADPAVAQRKERLRNYREQKQLMSDQGFGPQHREIRRIDLMVQATEQEMNAEIDRLLRKREELMLEQAKQGMEQTTAQLQTISQRLAEAKGRVQDLQGKLQRYSVYELREKLTTQRLSQVEELLNNVRLQESHPNYERIRLMFRATEPQLTFPKLPIVVGGSLFLFLGLTTGLVFLKEILDQRIKTPTDIRLLERCELLGVVPEATEDPSGPTQIEGAVQANPIGLMAEAFRQIRTVLLARMDRRGYKTLMIVGAQPECGVSVIVSNLAVSLAHNRRRVVVIDANYRRPAQHRLFGTPHRPGLIEVLVGSASLEEALVRKEDRGVDILPAGNTPDAPPELLEGSAFRNLLSQFESQYDFVLIDAPPALVAADSQMLAKRVDAVTCIVRAMDDKRGMINRMIRELDGHRADLLGLVLNGVRSSAGGYFRENYQKFYRYRQASLDAAARREAASAGQLSAED